MALNCCGLLGAGRAGRCDEVEFPASSSTLGLELCHSIESSVVLEPKACPKSYGRQCREAEPQTAAERLHCLTSPLC